jgi:mevalonate kinase
VTIERPASQIEIATESGGDLSSRDGQFGRARGKVILFGEHAVVYGVPAIAVGIERGARARARVVDPAGARPGRLRVAQWSVDVLETDEKHELGRALGALLAETRRQRAGDADTFAALGFRGIEVDAETELPPGGGLGCSAAIGVAIARAVDPRATVEQIEARVMAWERVFHGNPSGIDGAVAARGGSVQFERDAATSPGSIARVAVRGGLLLAVGQTGVVSSTRTMVDAVARVKTRRPDMVAKTFEGIRAIVKNGRLALEAGDKFAIGRLMDLNQMLLSGLFVSTEEIERMCDLARGAGAHGAKLTGAGGGGSVIALVPSIGTAERVLEAWEKAGFRGFSAPVSPAEFFPSETPLLEPEVQAG